MLVKQVPAPLDSHLKEIITPMHTRMDCTSNTTERGILTRGIALYPVAFHTTKRGDELSRTLIHRILHLPNESEFLFNFHWGNTMRDGADHLLAITYYNQWLATCLVRTVEQRMQIGTAAG